MTTLINSSPRFFTVRLRALAVMLTAGLVITATSMIAVPAHADSTDKRTADAVMEVEYKDTQGTARAFYYSDCKEAADAVNALGSEAIDVKLTLLKDASATVSTENTNALEITRSCELDLAGSTYTVNSRADRVNGIQVSSGATLILSDSSSAGTGTIRCTTTGAGNDGTPVDVKSAEKDADGNRAETTFIMEGGNLIQSVDYALATGSYCKTVVKDGVIHGGVSARGDFTLEGGLIEDSSPVAVVICYPSYDKSYSGTKFTMTGGIIRNTDTKSPIIDDNSIEALQVECGDSQTTITGGVLESVNGPAMKVYNYGTTLEGGEQSSVTISGDAMLASKNDAAVRVSSQIPVNDTGSRDSMTISGNASLSGDGSAIEFYRQGSSDDAGLLTCTVEGGWFKYGDGVPFKANSSLVSYPAGYVMSTEPAVDSEHEGYYTLAAASDGYQDFDQLNLAINAARDTYEAGNDIGTYDASLWKKFKAAYEAALPIPTNANANQNEIDWFADQLVSAQQKMVDRANSGIDVSNLADGVYSVQIGMRMYPEGTKISMSNGAVDHTATLVMRGGKGTLYLDFTPTYVNANWGSLMQLWSFRGSTPAEALENSTGWASVREAVSTGGAVEAEYLSWQMVDMTTGDVAALAGVPSEAPSIDNEIRPKRVSIEMPYMGAANDCNKLYVHVRVDMMEAIGVGNESAVVVIDYSTLAQKDVSEADQSAADAVSKQVAALPSVGKLALSDKAKVQAARAAWQALTDDQKVLVDEAPLKAAEARIAALETTAKNQGNKNSDSRKVVKKVTSATVGGITYKLSGKSAVAAKGKKSLKKATVKSTVKIGGKTYKVTGIKANAFKGCKKLTKITVGKNVTSIGKSAFQGDKKLKSITIGTKMKSIGAKVFYQDSKLTKVIFKGKALKKIGSKAFKGTAKKLIVKAPKAKKKAYKKLIVKAGASKAVKVK